MDATLELTHERVDDVPLLLGFLIKLKLDFRTGVLHFFRGQRVQSPRSPFWRSDCPAQLGGSEAIGSCHDVLVNTD